MEDLLLNTAKELDVQNGDFVTGESTLQHQDLLMMTNKGEWKESPLVAVGAAGFLKDNDFAGLMAEVKTQFEKDGMTVKKISFDGENLNTDAHY
jgi:hypothetical protein